MTGIKVILHPTDFSEYSARAFQFACSLARDNGATLIVAHVAPPLQDAAPVGAEGLVLVPRATTEEHRATIRKNLEAIQAPVGSELTVKHVFRIGNAVDELLKLIKEEKVDLLVMGTHGRTGISRFLLGSTAEQMVRRATCPVITLKLPSGPGHEQAEWEAASGAMQELHV